MNTIPALIDKAEASLRAARLLGSEGYFDFAVGRLHAVMRYVAEAFLIRHGYPVADAANVPAAFALHLTATGYLPGTFNRFLTEAARLRQRAEYETDTGITAEDVAEQLDRAKAFLYLAREELADTPKSPPHAAA